MKARRFYHLHSGPDLSPLDMLRATSSQLCVDFDAPFALQTPRMWKFSNIPQNNSGLQRGNLHGLFVEHDTNFHNHLAKSTGALQFCHIYAGCGSAIEIGSNFAIFDLLLDPRTRHLELKLECRSGDGDIRSIVAVLDAEISMDSCPISGIVWFICRLRASKYD